ncbi:MAG TPA: chemotaxis-specific protein-glutamate methyltransferase CheB [Mycobacteriales bacterium]|nr:chemotaxis-specific protein-glutamate methyltransferase CheB [Mycobacteriales bacterium]
MSAAPPPGNAGSGGSAPVRVVIVDDSAVQRRFARSALEADGQMTVVGEARNGRDAVAMVDRLQPEAVLMDLHLPVMNGIEAIERIMATRPTPILVYSAFVDGEDRDNAAAALAAGAVDVMAKPGPRDSGHLDEYAEALRKRLRVAGRAKVITHPRGRLGGANVTLSTRRLGGGSAAPQIPPPPPQSEVLDGLRRRKVRVIGIGASTGGPQALATVLGELPEDLEAAVVVVQHMADGFIEGLAHWLDGLCALPVSVASAGRRLAPGTVSIAPSGVNLIVHDSLRVTAAEPPTTQYHVPGIDETLSSIASAVGQYAVGVLLTGMGRDGALGLKRMRERGALTIAQDEATSAVYGMPAAAVAIGAAELQLPIGEIGPALRQVAASVREATP